MNTRDVFQATPMSAYDPLSRPKSSYNNIRDVSLESIQERMIPRQMVTGSTRGTQTVGYGGTKIDGTNNRIIIKNSADGTSIGLGVIPGSTTDEFGFFSLDADDNLVLSIIQGKLSLYDHDDDDNERMRVGKQPDNTYNVVTAKDGYGIEDVFA